MADNELPIRVALEADDQSFKEIQQRLEGLGAYGSEAQFSPAEARFAAGQRDPVQALEQLALLKKAAADTALALQQTAAQAAKLTNQWARSDLMGAGLGRDPRGRFQTTDAMVGEEVTANRTTAMRVGGVVGTILGRQDSPYPGEDPHDLYRLKRDQAEHRSRTEAFRVAGQAAAGTAGYDAQLLAEEIKAEAAVREYYKVIAEAIARGRVVPEQIVQEIQDQHPDLLPDARATAIRKTQSEAGAQRNAANRAYAQAIEDELGPLEESVRYAQARAGEVKRRERIYQQLAEAEAAMPGTLDAQTRNLIKPEVLTQAQRDFDRQRLVEVRDAQHQATRDYFYNPDAPFADRFRAGVRGLAPGQQRSDKVPFGADFLSGLFGRDASLQNALGQATKFSILYGGLYRIQSLVTSGFAAAAKGALDYEEALVSLNQATGATSDANEQLARTASSAGTAMGFGPAAGVTAAAQAVGLYDLNSATPYDRQQIAQQSVEVSGRLARVSGEDVGTVQEQLAGVIRSFGLSPYDQSHLEDQVTYVSRRTGRTPGEILNATAQLGTIASTAGYDPAEAMAMVARIATTTGQSADAVAGQLSQVLSRAGDPSVLARLSSVGVNTVGTTLKQQIQQLSQLPLDNNARSYTVQAFGRSRSGQSFDILLNQLANINQLAGQARTVQPGYGERNFASVMDALAKQLMVIGGHLQSIGNSLADIGFFDILKVGVGVISTFVEAIDNVLKIVTMLPGPFKELIGVTVSLIAAERAYAFLVGARGAIESFAEGAGVTKLVPGLRNVLGRLGPGVAAGAEGSAAARFFAGVEAARAGEAAPAAVPAALTLPSAATLAGVVASLAGVYGLLQTHVGGREGAGASQQALTEAQRAAASADTPQALKEAASRYDAAVRQAQKNQELSLSSFMDQGFAPFRRRFQQLVGEEGANPDAGIESEGQARAAALRKQAADIEESQRTAAQLDPAAAFGGFGSVQTVADALGILTQSGYSAAQQLAALNRAFENMLRVTRHVADAAAIVGPGLDTAFTTAASAIPGKALDATRARLQGEIGTLAPSFATRLGDWTGLGWVNRKLSAPGDDLVGPAQQIRARDQTDLEAVNAVVSGQGLQQDAQRVASSILANAPRDASGQAIITQKAIDQYRDTINQSVVKQLKATGKAYSKDLVVQLTTFQTQGIAALLQQYGGKIITPELIDAYTQAAPALAGAQSQQAAQAARDPRILGTNLIRDINEQHQNVLDAINALPTDTPAARVVAAQKLAAEMQSFDAAMGQALDSDVQARWAQVDAAVAIRQSGYAAGDQMGRLNEQIKGIQEKLALTAPPGTEATSVVPVTKPADASTAQPGGLSASVNSQLGAFGAGTGNLSGVAPDVSSQLGAFGVSTTTGVAGAPAPVAPPAQSELSAYEKYQLQQQVAEAESQKRELQRQDRLNQQLLAVQPGDAAGIADAQNRAAQDDLARARSGKASPEYIRQLELNARQTEGAHLQADLAKQSGEYAAGLNVDDPLAQQETALQQATAQLQLANRGYANLAEAQAQWRKANHDLIEGQIALAAETRGDYDRTNPLQQARADLDTLRKQLGAAKDPQARARLQQQILLKQSETDVVDSQQRVQNIDDEEQLHQITHQAAQAARIAEKHRIDVELAGMKTTETGYYALKQQEVSLAKAILSASEQYSGQFNLRDIKLPTVYEIRRSLGGAGTDLTAASSSYITNNVQINGADFAKVVGYLQSLLGKNTGRSRGLAGRTVG